MDLYLPNLEKDPEIPDDVYVDPSARINGDVVLGSLCSVWFQVAIRGDVNAIRVGERSNIQDGCLFHTSYKTHPLTIGDDVTFGHGVIAHGCTIGNRVLIGMQSLVMDGAVIEDDVIIGAGSLVTEGKRIPAGSLAFGRPAKVVRELTDAERKLLTDRSMHYVETAAAYKKLGKWYGWSDNPFNK